MKRSLLLSLMLVCYVAAIAQVPQHFYNATNLLNFQDRGLKTTNSKVQFLYTPGQLNTPTVAPSGRITSVYFRSRDNVTNSTWTNLTVKLGQPNQNSFTSATFLTTPMTQVFFAASYSVPAIAQLGWLKLDLPTPYTYDATLPLVVEVSNLTATNGFPLITVFTANDRLNYANSQAAAAGTLDKWLAGFGVDVDIPCDVPHGFTATNIWTNTATLNWLYKYNNAKGWEYLLDFTKADPTGTGYQPLYNPPIVLNNLIPDTCYYVHLRTNCTSTKTIDTISDLWMLDSFCTLPTCDMPPVTIDTAKIQATTAIVNWDPVPNVKKYEYAVSISPIPPQQGYFTTYTSVKLQGLTPATYWFFHIRAYCEPVPMSPWRTVQLQTRKSTSIEDAVNGAFYLDAFPNPATNTVTVKTEGRAANARLLMTDMTGKIVRASNVNTDNVTIDVQDLPSGMYFVRYSDDAISEVIKITKQ